MGTRLLRLSVLLLLPVSCVSGLGRDTLATWLASGAPPDSILVDLREARELAASQVIGSDSCKPYNLPWTSGVCSTAVSAAVPKSSRLVVYCARGNRSGKATAWLVSHGYTGVYDAGGYADWRGPTKQSTWTKLIGDLPAPSMRARTTYIAHLKTAARASSRRSGRYTLEMAKVSKGLSILPSGRARCGGRAIGPALRVSDK